jgi:hypothetical protein
MKRHCPACSQSSFSLWNKVIAVWPFVVHCSKCGARVRLNVPRWQNILGQLLAQVVFWLTLLAGISSTELNALAAGIIGLVMALLIALLPGLFNELEVFPGHRAQ